MSSSSTYLKYYWNWTKWLPDFTIRKYRD